jgi:hypothetical protein
MYHVGMRQYDKGYADGLEAGRSASIDKIDRLLGQRTLSERKRCAELVAAERERCAALAIRYMTLRFPESIVPRFDLLFDRDPAINILQTVPVVSANQEFPPAPQGMTRDEILAEVRGAEDLVASERERCAAWADELAARIRSRK